MASINTNRPTLYMYAQDTYLMGVNDWEMIKHFFPDYSIACVETTDKNSSSPSTVFLTLTEEGQGILNFYGSNWDIIGMSGT